MNGMDGEDSGAYIWENRPIHIKPEKDVITISDEEPAWMDNNPVTNPVTLTTEDSQQLTHNPYIVYSGDFNDGTSVDPDVEWLPDHHTTEGDHTEVTTHIPSPEFRYLDLDTSLPPSPAYNYADEEDLSHVFIKDGAGVTGGQRQKEFVDIYDIMPLDLSHKINQI